MAGGMAQDEEVTSKTGRDGRRGGGRRRRKLFNRFRQWVERWEEASGDGEGDGAGAGE